MRHLLRCGDSQVSSAPLFDDILTRLIRWMDAAWYYMKGVYGLVTPLLGTVGKKAEREKGEARK